MDLRAFPKKKFGSTSNSYKHLNWNSISTCRALPKHPGYITKNAINSPTWK